MIKHHARQTALSPLGLRRRLVSATAPRRGGVWAFVFLFGAAIRQPTIVAAEPASAAARPDLRVASAPADKEKTAPAARVELIRELMRRRGGEPAALAQLIQFSRNLDPATTASMFDELAAAHVRAGNLDLAAETRRALAEQFPDEPQGRAALLWVVQLYSSSEVAHARRRAGQGDSLQLPRSADDRTPVSLLGDDQSLARYALYVADNAASAHPALNGEAALAFQRSVAARRAGETKKADALLSPLKHRRADDPWGQCARCEAWLEAQKESPPPKPVAHCSQAADTPKLDGLLDDPCWQSGEAIQLKSAGASPPSPLGAAEVRFAYDRQFLYVAVSCSKAPGVAYPSDNRARTHDADVEEHDRVRLRLDLDRDYASFFELVVDSRGWTAEGCWNDATWNPQWYVAAGEPASAGGPQWTAEAAIPLAELASRPPQSHDAWACAVERLAPNVVGESWTDTPPESPGPEAFGLLLFD